jgi:hypothetical protein
MQTQTELGTIEDILANSPPNIRTLLRAAQEERRQALDLPKA